MGNPSYGDDGPQICWNGAKSWESTWYNSDSETVDAVNGGTFKGELVGVGDWALDKFTSGEHHVVIKIPDPTSNLDYYVIFNRKIGPNNGVTWFQDQVHVTTGKWKQLSWSQARLEAGGIYTVNNFGGTTHELRVEVCDINITNNGPSTASVLIYLKDGDNDQFCGGSKPTNSPTITASPTTFPTKSPTQFPTETMAPTYSGYGGVRLWTPNSNTPTNIWDVSDLSFYPNNNCSGTKLQTQGTITESNHNSCCPPERAFDNSDSTLWGGRNSGGNFWIGMSFTTAQPIKCVSFLDGKGHYAKQVTVQVSLIGSNSWTNVVEVDGIAGVRQNIPLGPATPSPTKAPTKRTSSPTPSPTNLPKEPTKAPTRRTNEPTEGPTKAPTMEPTKTPTKEPTNQPTNAPTMKPTKTPTKEPTNQPTNTPTQNPSPTSGETICKGCQWRKAFSPLKKSGLNKNCIKKFRVKVVDAKDGTCGENCEEEKQCSYKWQVDYQIIKKKPCNYKKCTFGYFDVAKPGTTPDGPTSMTLSKKKGIIRGDNTTVACECGMHSKRFIMQCDGHSGMIDFDYSCSECESFNEPTDEL